MIDWIDYNIDHDPESVNLMLKRLNYDSYESFVESGEILAHCANFQDKLSNFASSYRVWWAIYNFAKTMNELLKRN